MSEKLQDPLDMVDIKDATVEVHVKTNDDNDVENEIGLKELSRCSDNSDSESLKSSRELKSILTLSTVANINTQISPKRKSTDLLVDKVNDKHESDMVDTRPEPQPLIRIDYTKTDDVSENQETKDFSNKNLDSFESDDSDKSKDSSNMVVVINDKRKDPFCWRCHHEKPTIYCERCPRSFHQKCLKHSVTKLEQWVCPVCVGISKSENDKERSPIKKEVPSEHFSTLLKFALKRMMQVEGHEPFIQPVNEVVFPEYKKYVAQPQDLTCLERNIKNDVYMCTQAFEADAQWILHNSIIFNAYQSKLTSIAKSMMKICKQEMSEIENCSNCYLNANTKKKTWFVEVCPKPHMVVWAKLKGFPYWPAKVMRINSLGMVDVRFFGAHDRAWVPSKDCFLYCLQDPNSNKQKRNDINESIKELNIYIENLKRMYGEFRYAPFKVAVEPEEELKQLKILLPRYNPDKKINPGRGFRRSLHRNGNCSTPDFDSAEKNEEENLIQMDESLPEEIDITPDGSNSDSTPDDLPSASNLPGRGSNVRMRGGLVNTSGKIKVFTKISPTRKRLSCEDLYDLPPKLSRHNSDENINHIGSTISESNSDLDKHDCSSSVNEDECPKLIDETNIQDVTRDILFKKISDLIEEEPKKDNIVSETDLLLDTVTNIDIPDLEIERDIPCILNKPVKENKEIVGTVEVIEVNVNENIEPMEIPKNIEDIVEASDISTVSICPIEPEIENVSQSIHQPIDTNNSSESTPDLLQSEDQEMSQFTSLSSTDTLEQNLNSNSSTDEYTNPLDFVEVTETIPEENLNCADKPDDILEVLVETVMDSEDTGSEDNDDNNKHKRNSSNVAEKFIEEEDRPQKKSLKLINIDNIRIKTPDNSRMQSTSTPSLVNGNDLLPITTPIRSLQSLLEKHLTESTNSSANDQSTETVIKSEPITELQLECQSEAENKEMKLIYLSALNISEKMPLPPKKPISMRTRSKSEENKLKHMSNISRVIEDCAIGGAIQSNEISLLKPTPPRRREIFVKPLAKMQTQKQKARKSFPLPFRTIYPSQPQHKKELLKLAKATTNTSLRNLPVMKTNEIYTPTNNILYITHAPNVSNFLPPNQPITYSANKTVPVVTTAQQNNYTLSTAAKTSTDKFESQNYIPMCGEVPKPRSNNYPPITVTAVTENSSTPSTTAATCAATTETYLSTTGAVSDLLDGMANLESLVPDTLSKTISEVICRAPPKLKPRPPGPLSSYFDEGLPSSAGTVSSRINSISHRLTDYFRGMLVELLQEMGTVDNPIMEITKLKLENEELKHKHSEEIIAIKKNAINILKDVEKSIENERDRIIDEIRSACETECVKRVAEAKSKQWCANCPKEAQFYCCWNTSYCDFPCQEKHWPRHMSKCTQNIQNPKTPQPSIVPTTPRPGQSLILRPAIQPKSYPPKSKIAKSATVLVNRSSNNPKTGVSYMRTTSGSHITLFESTPGNYELVGNGGPISVGGKLLTGLGKVRGGNIISVPTTTINGPSTSTGLIGNSQKAIIPSSHIVQSSTTVISDEM